MLHICYDIVYFHSFNDKKLPAIHFLKLSSQLNTKSILKSTISEGKLDTYLTVSSFFVTTLKIINFKFYFI